MKRLLLSLTLVPLITLPLDLASRCQRCEERKKEAQKKRETIIQHIINIILQFINIAVNSKNQDKVLASTAQIVQSLGEVGKASTRAAVTEQELLSLVHEIARLAPLDADTTSLLCDEVSLAYYELSTMSTNSLAH